MSHIIKAIIAVALLTFYATSAVADIRVGIEVPLSYNFKEADDGSSFDADGLPSGYIVLAQLPFFSGGVGLESYDIKLDQSGDHQIDLLMADLFYVLPIPVVDIALGVGYGNVELKGDSESQYEKSNCSQYFLRIGVPIGAVFTVLGSYHSVFARINAKGGDNALEVGGTLTTIGVAVGF